MMAPPSHAMPGSLLRFITCGSVDDGKSTLIGRLLYETGSVPQDEMATLARDSRRHGTTGGEPDYALLVDGLEAEREQAITIDVAYRFFTSAVASGSVRRFIVADTPGHEQYTRNMATGASTADLAVVLLEREPRPSPPDEAPLAHREPDGHPAHCARGEQDGPDRIWPSSVRGDPRGV